jgi:hypothetical protein
VSERWCKNCKQWVTASEDCPLCGRAKERFNKTLYTALLNNHLYASVQRVHKETTDQAHFVKQARIEQARVERP